MINKIQGTLKTNKKRVIVVGILVVLLIAIIGFSYAWLRTTILGEENVQIVVGDLDLILDESSTNGIQLTNAVPAYDDEGKTYEPYVFSLKNQSNIDLYYRTSDYYFSPDDNNIAWERLSDTTNIISSSSIRYIQIRAVLKSNVDRNITPTLNNVDIVYHKGRLPQVPVNLTATAVNNNSVVLRWEGDHKDIVGYKIYYGTKSGVYNEAEHTPIIVGNQNEYYVEGLKENEVYYFTITAIGGESGDIESGFSKEVYVRAVH